MIYAACCLAGIISGFIISMYVMRWAVSDLRERSRTTTSLYYQANEIAENQRYEIKRLHKKNAELRRFLLKQNQNKEA